MAKDKNLNFFLQAYGPLGIPNHSRDFAKALAGKLSDLRLVPIFPKPSNSVDAKYGMTKEITDNIGRPNIDYPALMFWYPNTYPEILGGYPQNIGYYIFEYTKIPDDFVQAMNELDGVCTASQWGVDVLRENGVKVPCYVIPGGVDHNKFNSGMRKISKDVFKFLHIGKFENRKGTGMLIEAFNEAFEGDPSIRLTMSIDNSHVKRFSADEYLNGWAHQLVHPVDNIDIIHYVKDVRNLYNTHHAAVFPTKGEGIGLPITEAMSCGLPVIATYTQGVTEYANDRNSILLRNTIKVPVHDENFFPHAGVFGEWDSPTKEELVEKLKWVYNNYREAEKIGENAEKYMRDIYSWENAADKYIKEVLNA